MSSSSPHVRNVINLGNSIIGVSILAMPYCFKKCGILLSFLVIVGSGILTRISCHLLLKSAIMARRRNFEFLAFHTFGSTGKLIVEVGVIGFLIGVSIAFFVVVGDLGPALVANFFMIENTPKLRAELLLFLGIFVAFPLGLLRKVESLTSLSALSIVFYVFLILKTFSEAAPHLVIGQWWHEVEWWRPQGFLPCLPIFSLALSCQTQLFEFFDTMNEPSLKKMDQVVNGAVNLCSLVYILVGLFGYIALYDQPILGNVLAQFSPTVFTDLFKIGFIASVVISYPLCLFPCRTSLHSLLFKQGHYEFPGAGPIHHIPDHRFRNLTIFLVIVTIGTAILLPNIEFVLGMIGSTIGTTICFILPALVFIRLTDKHTNERKMAQLVLCTGVFILVACTYSTLEEANKPAVSPPLPPVETINLAEITSSIAPNKDKVSPLLQVQDPEGSKVAEGDKESPDIGKEVPQPKEIIILDKPASPNLPKEVVIPPLPEVIAKEEIKVKEDDGTREEKKLKDAENMKYEDKIIKAEKDIDEEKAKETEKAFEAEKAKEETKKLQEKQEVLIKKLEAQQAEAKIILEEQKKVLLELQKHKETHKVSSESPAQQNQFKEIVIPKEKDEKVKKEIDANLLENQKVPEISLKESSIKQLPNPKPTQIKETKLGPKQEKEAPRNIPAESLHPVPVKLDESAAKQLPGVPPPKINPPLPLGEPKEVKIAKNRTKIKVPPPHKIEVPPKVIVEEPQLNIRPKQNFPAPPNDVEIKVAQGEPIKQEPKQPTVKPSGIRPPPDAVNSLESANSPKPASPSPENPRNEIRRL